MSRRNFALALRFNAVTGTYFPDDNCDFETLR